ncbi:MAG TPA: response regulator [Gammaproteobacteria bacterium]|nr:response regulator [Gammaproteobacteria bacterium]
MSRILLADDDAELCGLLSEYLAQEGFEVDAVHDGAAAVERARSGAYDIVVLDVMMPKVNGFDALRMLREHVRTPVLMLTARGDDVDRIVGLEMGADDYLPKPCNPRELVARLRAILRRSQAWSSSDETVEPVVAGDLELRPGNREVLLSGAPLILTSAEFNVLETLVRRIGRVVSKSDLSEQALGRRLERYDRSIDVHVSNLRKKLGPLSGGLPRIKTVRGAGYIYVQANGRD